MANDTLVARARRLGRNAGWLTLSVLLGLASCSMQPLLESQPVSSGRILPMRGTSYYLPKKLLRVQVWGSEELKERLDAKGEPVFDENGQAKTYIKTTHFAVHRPGETDEIIIPDHRHQFVIAPQWDIGSDDFVKIKVGDGGLLESVEGKARDERADIAQGFVELYRMLVTKSDQTKWSPPEPMQTMRGVTRQPRAPWFEAEYEFDPVDPQDRARVTAALNRYNITMKITKQPDCPTASSGAGCCTTCESTNPGIYYRLPIPYRLSLSPAGKQWQAGGASGTILHGGMERTVLLPNEAICIYAPVSRASFVTSHTTLTFNKGMLTDVVSSKPSQLLGFVRIPIDAATAILAIPKDLLTVRIEHLGQESQLVQAESAQAEAERAKIESMMRLLDEKRKMEAGPSEDLEGTP